jgi:hypothetical protein
MDMAALILSKSLSQRRKGAKKTRKKKLKIKRVKQGNISFFVFLSPFLFGRMQSSRE